MSNVSQPVTKAIGNKTKSEKRERGELDISRWAGKAALAGAAAGFAAVAAALLYVSRRKRSSEEGIAPPSAEESLETG